jgi:hypothetical protein
MVKVNRKYDVPYGAGTSKGGKTVYIDHRVPTTLKLKNGQKVNVIKALVAHETTEKRAMDRGLRYQEAHKKFAIPAENKEVREGQHVSPEEYNRTLGDKLKIVEKYKDAPTPPDLEPKPYKDTKKLSLLKSLIHKKHG